MEINPEYDGPLVTVVVPCYNSEPWITKCLESIVDQTYKNIEIIVVDDGSTDKTAQVVNSFEASNIKYYLKSNGGSSSARNVGIRQAKGELIAFLDSDDVWHKNKLSEQVAVMLSGYDFVYCDYESVDSKGRIGQHTTINPKQFKAPIKTLLLNGNIVAGGSSVLLKKRILDTIGGFREDLIIGEDWELWTRIFWNEYKHFFINKKLLYVVKNEKSVQHTTSDVRWKTSVDTVLKSFFYLPNINKREKALIYNRLFLNSYRFNSTISEILSYRQKSVYYNPTILLNFKSNLITAKALLKYIINSLR